MAGAAVAAVGAIALPTAGTIGHCFTPLSIQYAHPPAASCVTSPDLGNLSQTVLGAALVSILFVPAAHAAAILAGRRIRQGRRTPGARAVEWLAGGAAVIAAVTGTALWGPQASAHGVVPAGSIGRDGWIRGYAYQIRLIPDWYAGSGAGKSGLIVFTFPVDAATIDLQSLAAVNSVQIADYRSLLLRLGAHPVRLDRAPGLRIARPGLPHGILEQWFIVRAPAVYLITLHQSPYGSIYLQDSPYLEQSLTRMLHTWHWTNPG